VAVAAHRVGWSRISAAPPFGRAARRIGSATRWCNPFGALRAKGIGALPFSWVFVPVAILVGLAGGIVIALIDGLARPMGPTLLAGVATAYGLLLRRLARIGRLPLPAE